MDARVHYPDPDDIETDEFGEPINGPSYEPYDELINWEDDCNE